MDKNKEKLINLFKKTFGKRIKIKNNRPEDKQDNYKKHVSWEYMDMFWDWLGEGSFITEAFKIKNKKKLRKRIIELYCHGISFNVEYEPICEYFRSAVENNDLKIVKLLIDDMAAVYSFDYIFSQALAVSRNNNYKRLTNFLIKRKIYHEAITRAEL